jgi:hypothetical protein
MIPGWASTKMLPGVYYSGSQLANTSPGLVAVPIKSFSKPAPGQVPTNLHQLASDATFTPVLNRFENIQYGTLAKRVETKPIPRATEETYEFRSTDALMVFIECGQRKRSRQRRCFSLRSRRAVVDRRKAVEIRCKTGTNVIVHVVEGGHIKLKPAIYRVDVLTNSSAIWRAFFKIRRVSRENN